jgi:hypothetical protein
VQLVEPGFRLQLSVHCEPQLAVHCAAQPEPVQSDMHPAWQSLVHCSLQVNVEGVVVQAVLQRVWQVSVHVVVGDEVHMVPHVVVKFTGTHCEVHPPPVSK